jgi:ssDNA-binding Zn-finger/Zn-ribbon topoisomerase 1
MPSILCPDCGTAMLPREGRFGHFLGCSRFPDCRGAHAANARGEPVGTPANAKTRRLRHHVMNALRTGTLDSGVLTRPVSEMIDWECEAALQYMDDFPEPMTLEEKTLWDHLVSEAEAEN